MPFKTNFVEYKSNFKKNEFFDFAIGKHIVRLLQEEPTIFFTHFLAGQNIMFKCLQDDCPVCARNRELYAAAKSRAEGEKVNTQNITGYSAKGQTAYINVLDRTLVKICPKESCAAEVKPNNLQGKFPSACPDCGTLLSGVKAEPLNKVKILTFGKEIAAQIEAAESSTFSESGEPVGILNMDLDLMVLQGSGNGKKSKTVTSGAGRDLVDITAYTLFDLTTALAEFTAEEIVDIMNGTKVRDIYAARRSEVTEPAVTSKEDVDDILGGLAQL